MILDSLRLLKARQRLRSVAIADLNTMKSYLDDLGKDVRPLEEYIMIFEGETLTLDLEIMLIMDQVNQLQDETLIRILLYRYDQGWKISAIAEEMYYSTQWIHELLNRGCGIIELLYSTNS